MLHGLQSPGSTTAPGRSSPLPGRSYRLQIAASESDNPGVSAPVITCVPVESALESGLTTEPGPGRAKGTTSAVNRSSAMTCTFTRVRLPPRISKGIPRPS